MAIGCSIDECPPTCEARGWCERLGIYQRFARTTGQDRSPVTELDGIVQVAYLHSEHVSHSWHESFRAMLDHDLRRAVADGADLARCIENGYRIARKPLNLRCASGLVAHTRNYGARLFLDKTPHEWLLWIDTDMGFAADSAHRLLAAADAAERPVVGALCFALMEAAYDGMGGWRRTIVPTMYKLGTADETGEPSFCYFGDYQDDTVTAVAGTGGAFILIHRTALEKVRADCGDRWYDMFFDRAGDIVGEDIAFCGRLLKAGIIPAVHTGVKTTHHKEIWVGELDYVMQEAVVLQPYPDLTVAVDLEKSFGALARHDFVSLDMLKLQPDLDRYAQILEATRPEVIVECGTHTGASARWFAEESGAEIITIDVDHAALQKPPPGRSTIVHLLGSSTDPKIVGAVEDRVGDRRCMVVLDSDHSAPHVAREIELYGPLVSAGCYLVVEDALFGYGHEIKKQHGMARTDGSPLDAIVKALVDNPDWSRDLAIERTDPISSNPAGYWVRNG